MFGKLLCLACAVSAVCAELATTACSEDSQCSSDFYCDRGLLSCRPCMKCGDLMRADLDLSTDCVKSLVQCGPCLQGFSEERFGDFGTRCIHNGTLKEFPLYVWIVLGVAALLLTISVAVVLVLMRTSHTFKMFTSSRTTVHSAAPPTMLLDVPPAYSPSPPTAPLPLASPPIPIPMPVVTRYPPFDDSTDGSQYPLIKPLLVGRRETAGSQETRVFNNPVYYTQGIQVSDSPESYDNSDIGESFPPLDEDTTESTWAPGLEPNHNTSRSASPSTSTLVVNTHNTIARGSYENGPPAKIVCTRQDTNNNGSSSSTQDNTNENMPFTSHFGLPFIINVVKNINTVQQRSDSSSSRDLYD